MPALTVGTSLALTLAALFTIGLGIVPGGLFNMAQQAAAVLFR